MKKLFKKLEATMAAVAFAEEGEFDTARQIMQEDKPRKSDRPSAYRFVKPTERKVLRAD